MSSFFFLLAGKICFRIVNHRNSSQPPSSGYLLCVRQLNPLLLSLWSTTSSPTLSVFARSLSHWVLRWKWYAVLGSLLFCFLSHTCQSGTWDSHFSVCSLTAHLTAFLNYPGLSASDYVQDLFICRHQFTIKPSLGLMLTMVSSSHLQPLLKLHCILAWHNFKATCTINLIYLIWIRFILFDVTCNLLVFSSWMDFIEGHLAHLGNCRHGYIRGVQWFH